MIGVKLATAYLDLKSKHLQMQSKWKMLETKNFQMLKVFSFFILDVDAVLKMKKNF
jgi:hypothetical protein